MGHCSGNVRGDRLEIISRQSVVAGCDAPKVLHPVKCRLDPPAQLVEALVEGERLFSIGSILNDRLGATLVQLLAQFAAIICGVAKHALRWLHSSDKALCDRTIMRLASRQQDGDQAPSSICSICECMNLRVAPSARATNSLLLLPPLPPAAERCALICVESIICVLVDRPFPASSRNRFSQTPRRAQRTKRL